MLKNRHSTRIPHRRVLLDVNGVQVMVRIAGCGPAVLALHESPRSSISLLSLIDALADRYTVVALDTPGYGESDPTGLDRPEASDFVAVIAAVQDALGLRRSLLYGTHTGAALAVSFALSHPERVAALVLDGLAAFDTDEQADFTGRYLAPFEPRWDGSHLAELWSRTRDLFMWFPYHHRDAAHRLQTELPSVEALYGTVRGFLASGSGYWRGYRCAGALDAPAAAAMLRVPTLLTARSHDLIAAHLQRVTKTDFLDIKPLGAELAEWADALRAHFGGHAADEPAVSAPQGERQFCGVGGGAIHYRFVAGQGKPLVVIPDIPTGARDTALETIAGAGRPLWIIDPTGCGASDPLQLGESQRLSAWLQPVAATIDALGIDSYDLFGVGIGAAFARQLAKQHDRAGIVLSERAPAWTVDAARLPRQPLLQKPWADPDGGVLFSSWYRLRDLRYYESLDDGLPRRRWPGADAECDVASLYAAHKGLWLAPECADLVTLLQESFRE